MYEARKMREIRNIICLFMSNKTMEVKKLCIMYILGDNAKDLVEFLAISKCLSTTLDTNHLENDIST